MNRKHITNIIVLTVVSCLMLYVIEQVLLASYIVKTGSKIVLFLLIPLWYIKIVLKEPIWHSLRLNHIDKRRLAYGFSLGIVSMVIIILAYVILQDFIQAETIILDLRERLNITFETYIFIALYITFGNSLLEEFYFRGFIFLKFYQSDYKLLGYIFSSGLFAVYHVAIFATWFDIWLIGLALIGLFTVGIVFCWLNTKTNNFLNSWILHICADIAVVSIGFYLFWTL
ncbi:CPBP family intramembrane glutamic endopeptidase [Tenuibacillus multivorans]|uniref:CAAX protease self-immunity n=1 Tax=Tenuibacillus multivorans TaxID=237069 RepID=A0A1G9YHF3_9BACI|nr:type II CAAX endopeptidase family protein [Tenuibacillus multivorans]SDN08362.1 CAAX protease self-immunity [Tenuibacillus multivorans]